MSSIEIITASEKRRYWTRGEKRRLVAALEDPDANVSEVARAAGVSTSLLYRWRQQLAAPRKRPAFIPVAVAPAEATSTAGLSQAAITIAFGASVRLTIEGAPDAQTLATVIGALTASDRLL
jgi:transposase-like protein